MRKTKGVEIGFASVSAAAVVFQLLMIVLRFLNIGFVNKYIGIVLIVVSSAQNTTSIHVHA